MVVLLVVLIGFLVPACIVLAFAAYPRQRHKLPPRFDPYPRVEAASERLRPTAKRFKPMAERFASAVTRSQPAVSRVRGAVENTDNHLRRLYGESVSRGTDRPVMPIPVSSPNPARGADATGPGTRSEGIGEAARGDDAGFRSTSGAAVPDPQARAGAIAADSAPARQGCSRRQAHRRLRTVVTAGS